MIIDGNAAALGCILPVVRGDVVSDYAVVVSCENFIDYAGYRVGRTEGYLRVQAEDELAAIERCLSGLLVLAR